MNENDRKLLAQNLKRFRRERHLSQAKLADLADVSVLCVKKIEGEKVDRPESAMLAALAFALKIPIGDFFRPLRTLKFVRFRTSTKPLEIDNEKTKKILGMLEIENIHR